MVSNEWLWEWWVEKDNTRDFGSALVLPSMPAHQSMLRQGEWDCRHNHKFLFFQFCAHVCGSWILHVSFVFQLWKINLWMKTLYNGSLTHKSHVSTPKQFSPDDSEWLWKRDKADQVLAAAKIDLCLGELRLPWILKSQYLILPPR